MWSYTCILSATGNFPHSPYLEAFFFVMPLVGIGIRHSFWPILATCFSTTAHKEWEMAIAST